MILSMISNAVPIPRMLAKIFIHNPPLLKKDGVIRSVSRNATPNNAGMIKNARMKTTIETGYRHHFIVPLLSLLFSIDIDLHFLSKKLYFGWRRMSSLLL